MFAILRWSWKKFFIFMLVSISVWNASLAFCRFEKKSRTIYDLGFADAYVKGDLYSLRDLSSGFQKQEVVAYLHAKKLENLRKHAFYSSSIETIRLISAFGPLGYLGANVSFSSLMSMPLILTAPFCMHGILSGRYQSLVPIVPLLNTACNWLGYETPPIRAQFLCLSLLGNFGWGVFWITDSASVFASILYDVLLCGQLPFDPLEEMEIQYLLVKESLDSLLQEKIEELFYTSRFNEKMVPSVIAFVSKELAKEKQL